MPRPPQAPENPTVRPKYFTHDWQAAEHSVSELAALESEVVVHRPWSCTAR